MLYFFLVFLKKNGLRTKKCFIEQKAILYTQDHYMKEIKAKRSNCQWFCQDIYLFYDIRKWTVRSIANGRKPKQRPFVTILVEMKRSRNEEMQWKQRKTITGQLYVIIFLRPKHSNWNIFPLITTSRFIRLFSSRLLPHAVVYHERNIYCP